MSLESQIKQTNILLSRIAMLAEELLKAGQVAKPDEAREPKDLHETPPAEQNMTILRERAKALITRHAENGQRDAVVEILTDFGVSNLSNTPDNLLAPMLERLEKIKEASHA